SVRVVPESTEPGWSMTPARCRSRSVRVVLPASTWARMPRLSDRAGTRDPFEVAERDEGVRRSHRCSSSRDRVRDREPGPRAGSGGRRRYPPGARGSHGISRGPQPDAGAPQWVPPGLGRYGGLTERPNVAVLKTAEGNLRGFESPTLRRGGALVTGRGRARTGPGAVRRPTASHQAPSSYRGAQLVRCTLRAGRWRTSSPTRTTGAGPRAGGGQGTSPCGPGAEFVRPCRARAGPGPNSAQPHELGHDGGRCGQPVRQARPGCWFQDLRHPRRPTAQASDPGESRAVAGAVTRSGAHRPRRRHVRPRDGDPARAPSHRSRRTTMNARRSTIVTATAVGAMLLMSACGGGGGSDA